jgi:hypothetical protein
MGSFGTDAAASAAKSSGAFSGVFDFSKAEADAKVATDKVAQDVATGGQRMIASAQQTAQVLKQIWGANGEGAAAPAPKPNVPNMDTTVGTQAKAAADAAKQAFSEEMQAAQDTEKGIETALNNELKTHQITMSQWLAGTNQALDAEALAVINAADKATAATALSSAQKEAIWAKEAHELQQIADQEANAQAKAAEQSVQEWNKATGEINNAFTSQIGGLLKGTTSWAQAFKNVLTTLTESVIKFFVNWGLKAAENVVLQIASQNSITAGIVAAMGLQGAAGAAAQKPGLAASITGDSGEAYAGFAAFFAPFLGPAAPAAAAGLTAQVSSTAMGIAALDVGGYVLSDGLAMIHSGETVTPANVVTPYAGNQGGSGGQTHIWNVTAIDAQSFVSALRNHSSELARTVRDMFNSQPSLRPSY